jgi:hypothetical protein
VRLISDVSDVSKGTEPAGAVSADPYRVALRAPLHSPPRALLSKGRVFVSKVYLDGVEKKRKKEKRMR